MSPALSLLVATKDRAEDLAGMLASLSSEWPELLELVVVDNGSQDRTAEVLEGFARAQPKLRVLELAEPGQSRALNVALRHARGELLAFIDDDVRVEPGWAAALCEAYRTLPHAGFQGRIRLPPDVRADPVRLAVYERYKTLPVIDYGEGFRERGTLTGANMAVRREVLECVGGFDERLGPGASGFRGDTDLAWRIRARGGAFAYVARAAAVHVYDVSRLNEEYFETYHRRLGHSRLIHTGGGALPAVWTNRTVAWTKSKLAALLGQERSSYQNKGRYFAYSEMLRRARAERVRR